MGFIENNGSLGELKVIRPSDSEAFNQACLNAIRKSFPMSNIRTGVIIDLVCSTSTIGPKDPNQPKLMQEIVDKAVSRISFAVDLPDGWAIPSERARVDFLMTTEGKALNIKTTKSSGNKDYDALIVKAIKDCEPYDVKGLEEDFKAYYISSRIFKIDDQASANSNNKQNPQPGSAASIEKYKPNGLLNTGTPSPKKNWHLVPTLGGVTMIKSD